MPHITPDRRTAGPVQERHALERKASCGNDGSADNLMHRMGGVRMRERTLKGVARTGFMLGCVAFLCIVWMVVFIRTDLNAVLEFGDGGYILAAGYLYLLLYHGFVFLHIILCFFKDYTLAPMHVGIGLLGIVSLFSFIVEKVMFDEVAREMAIEYPYPGEVVFIYGALGVHLLFVLLTTASLVTALKAGKAVTGSRGGSSLEPSSAGTE